MALSGWVTITVSYHLEVGHFMSKKIYTSGEVAEMLKIPARTARRYITNGKIRGTQNPITGTWTVTHDALEQFVSKNRIDPQVLAMPKRVLVVDDDPHLVLMMIRTLKRLDPRLEVEFSHNGYEAMMKIGAIMPDVICLDIQMPGVDGRELLQALRQNAGSNQIKVLVMTGHPDRLGEMLKLGADDTILKPFELDDLLGKIQRLLNAASPTGGSNEAASVQVS